MLVQRERSSSRWVARRSEVGTAVERPPEAWASESSERVGSSSTSAGGSPTSACDRELLHHPGRAIRDALGGELAELELLDETVRLSRLTLVLKPWRRPKKYRFSGPTGADRRRALATATRRRANWRPASPPGGLRSRRPRARRERPGDAARRIVLLPDPFGPRSARRSPRSTVRSTPSPDVLVAEAARERVGTNHRCSTLPRMGDSISLGRIAGIRIGINWSWLVVFGLIVVAFQNVFPNQNPVSPTTRIS